MYFNAERKKGAWQTRKTVAKVKRDARGITIKAHGHRGCQMLSALNVSECTKQQTTTKPFVSNIWGRLNEPNENYAGSVTWISFLHSFLSSNMPSLRPLTSISCRITFIHVFFGLPCALLACHKLICSTSTSVGLRRTWPNHCRRFSLIFSSIEAAPS